MVQILSMKNFSSNKDQFKQVLVEQAAIFAGTNIIIVSLMVQLSPQAPQRFILEIKEYEIKKKKK